MNVKLETQIQQLDEQLKNNSATIKNLALGSYSALESIYKDASDQEHLHTFERQTLAEYFGGQTKSKLRRLLNSLYEYFLLIYRLVRHTLQ